MEGGNRMEKNKKVKILWRGTFYSFIFTFSIAMFTIGAIFNEMVITVISIINIFLYESLLYRQILRDYENNDTITVGSLYFIVPKFIKKKLVQIKKEGRK